jgi:hypothetical protein
MAQSDEDASPGSKTPVSELAVKPTTLKYSVNLDKGTSETEHFTIKNKGTRTLEGLGVGAPSSPDFKITTSVPSTIPGKGSLTVDVEFIPTGKGADDGTISITSSATKGKQDATVHLNGKAAQKKPTPTAVATPTATATRTTTPSATLTGTATATPTATATVTVTLTPSPSPSPTPTSSPSPSPTPLVCTGLTSNRCGTQCTNFQTDPNNCGGCGKTCPTGYCLAGVCSVCTAGQPSLCDGECTNVTTDADNCGGCGNLCPTGQSCVSGQCAGIICADPNAPTQCEAISADDSDTDICVNLMTDPLSCGSCDNTCPGDGDCVGGLCASCAALGELTCNGECINGAADPNNCGGCGNTCPSGVCKSGTCAGIVCNDPNTPNVCNGNLCTNILTDSFNCGACGSPACPVGQTCQAGQCALPASNPCPNANIPDQCGSFCTNLLTDSQNCDACGEPCPSGTACSEGLCLPGTEPWVCNGQFTDLLSDSLNCGGCGIVCPGGIDDCQNGTCQTAPVVCGDPNTPNACNFNCVNFQTDPKNCNGCGSAFACASGQECNQGQCAAVPTATPTPASEIGTYYFSGFVPEYEGALYCGDNVVISGSFQIAPIAGTQFGNILGSLTAFGSPGIGCPDFSGSYSCEYPQGGFPYELGEGLTVDCTHPGSPYEYEIVLGCSSSPNSFTFDGSCEVLPGCGTSCPGGIDLLQGAEWSAGEGFGGLSVTP